MSHHSKVKPCLTSTDIRNSKGVRRLAMLTAYDYLSAALLDQAGVDMVLVGDSLGMVMLGEKDTLPVTVDHIIHHCRAVSRAVSQALLVADMPFMSYETGVRDALRNAGRIMAEGGARALKLEGGLDIVPQVRALIAAGIPVIGHVGLTPQRAAALGGFKVQGKTAETAYGIVEDAIAMEEAGCFAVLLECVPSPLAEYITSLLSVPTIGIGAGAGCDGQVLVFHDMLGFGPPENSLRFVKRYADIGAEISRATKEYINDVRSGGFPAAEHSFSMPEEEMEKIKNRFGEQTRGTSV